MNLQDYIRGVHKNSFQATTEIRADRIKREGSEFFTYVMAATAATVEVFFEVAHQFPRARKYAPLDFLEITNNDVVDLTLRINQGQRFSVPAGTMRTIRQSAGGIWQVGITNDHAATSTTQNKIVLSLRRMPMTIDDWARGDR
tara:strand:+ start:478 stop:906 length:429 start_codon:yes stop_codon:yes gene_type:complete